MKIIILGSLIRDIVFQNRIIIGVADWEKKLSVAKIKKEDMNKLVMDFLSSTTVHNVAEKFREESGTESILTSSYHISFRCLLYLSSIKDIAIFNNFNI